MPQLPTTNKNYAPEFTFADGYNSVVGNTVSPSIFETYDIGPSLTHTIGRHTLHYGGEFSLYHDVTGGIGQPNGTFGFGADSNNNNRDFTSKDPSFRTTTAPPSPIFFSATQRRQCSVQKSTLRVLQVLRLLWPGRLEGHRQIRHQRRSAMGQRALPHRAA